MTEDQAKPTYFSEDDEKSELEEGQVSSDESSDSSDSEFNDGYDENLMGDEEDQARLQALSEKERETEIFKRSERRDALRRRWEIEQKLRQAKRAERAKDKTKRSVDKTKKDSKRKKSEQEKNAVALKGDLRKFYFWFCEIERYSVDIFIQHFLLELSNFSRERRCPVDSNRFPYITVAI